jgi:F-type H+-transporting ATPase subunit epsilon
VTVLADTAIRAKDLDEAKVKLAREEAERIIANRGTPMEVAAAQARLAEVAAMASALDRLKKTLKH